MVNTHRGADAGGSGVRTVHQTSFDDEPEEHGFSFYPDCLSQWQVCVEARRSSSPGAAASLDPVKSALHISDYSRNPISSGAVSNPMTRNRPHSAGPLNTLLSLSTRTCSSG